MMKRLNAFLCVLLVLIIVYPGNAGVYASDAGSQAGTDEKISLYLDDPPKVDIQLAVGNSTVDMSSFQEDLCNELKERGVDTSNFNIVATQQKTVSTEMEDAAKIFSSWGRIGWKGQWSYDSKNKVIVNAENTDNYTGFYYPECFDYRDIDFSYENTSADPDDDVMGAMIRFNKNADGSVTTYTFSMDRGDNGGGVSTAEGGGGLYKIVNKPFERTKVTLLQEVSQRWNRGSWDKYRFVAKGSNIKVYMNNQCIVDYTDKNNPILSGSYGFFSYSQPYAKFRNITIVTEQTKPLSTVLTDTNWSDDSIHFVINLNDELESSLSTDSSMQKTADFTKAKGIYYIGWGNSINQTQSLQFVEKNNGNGTFIENGDYNASIVKIANYILYKITYLEGKGTKDNPYMIHNRGQIISMKYNMHAYYALAENVDFKGMTWTGIGSSDNPFCGGFDGRGFTVSNVTICSGSYTGFFDYVSNGEICDLNIINIVIKGGSHIGGIAGHVTGSKTLIENCSIEEAVIQGSDSVGGIVGWIEDGSIVGCVSSADVSGSIYIGGVVGSATGVLIKDCYSTATVTGKECVGGVAGRSSQCRFETCQSISTVIGNDKVGGVIGCHNGRNQDGLIYIPDVVECEDLSTVKGYSSIGGIIGYSENTNLIKCISGGVLEGAEDLDGLIGSSVEGSLTDCDNLANVVFQNHSNSLE